MSRRLFAFAVAGFMLAGCALPEPVIDPASIHDDHAYKSDLYDCQTVAYEAIPDPWVQAMVHAVVGGAIGAASGAAIGAAFGNAGQGAAIGSAAGGTYMGVVGGADAQSNRKTIVANCMAQRGYAVLLP
jgi:outer membrane lipoprotein SlyB